MSESFKVGDLVQILPGTADPDVRHCIGMTGQINELNVCWHFIGEYMHGVVTDSGDELEVGISCLRKLPPKQDWTKLCNLTEVPCEVACA